MTPNASIERTSFGKPVAALPIRNLDYTVIFARNMPAMREFYGARTHAREQERAG